jgi:hypothetical protein
LTETTTASPPRITRPSPAATADRRSAERSRAQTAAATTDIRSVGILTQSDVIHAQGELYFNNGPADTDHAIGFLNKDTLAGGPSTSGLGIFEMDPAASLYRALYTTQGGDLHGNRISGPMACIAGALTGISRVRDRRDIRPAAC